MSSEVTVVCFLPALEELGSDIVGVNRSQKL